MKYNLTEEQLRNIVYNTIKESVYGDEMYFIEDEADGATYSNVADKEEAIADAKEMAKNGGRFLVKDREDNVVFDTGGPSYKFESIEDKKPTEIKCNESQLREYVSNIIRESLDELNFFDRIYNAHTPSNKEISNPTPIDIIKKDGWIVRELGNGKYEITQKTGAFANTNGTIGLDELVNDELNKYYFKGQQRVKIISRENQFNDYSDAEKAIIQIS